MSSSRLPVPSGCKKAFGPAGGREVQVFVVLISSTASNFRTSAHLTSDGAASPPLASPCHHHPEQVFECYFGLSTHVKKVQASLSSTNSIFGQSWVLDEHQFQAHDMAKSPLAANAVREIN